MMGSTAGGFPADAHRIHPCGQERRGEAHSHRAMPHIDPNVQVIADVILMPRLSA